MAKLRDMASSIELSGFGVPKELREGYAQLENMHPDDGVDAMSVEYDETPFEGPINLERPRPPHRCVICCGVLSVAGVIFLVSGSTLCASRETLD